VAGGSASARADSFITDAALTSERRIALSRIISRWDASPAVDAVDSFTSTR